MLKIIAVLNINTKEEIMANGTIKWFNSTKGYGFITPEDGGKDIFFHNSALVDIDPRNVRENQKVAYELGSEGGKTFAKNIKTSR